MQSCALNGLMRLLYNLAHRCSALYAPYEHQQALWRIFDRSLVNLPELDHFLSNFRKKKSNHFKETRYERPPRLIAQGNTESARSAAGRRQARQFRKHEQAAVLTFYWLRALALFAHATFVAFGDKTVT
jgi:predicted acyl esterase